MKDVKCVLLVLPILGGLSGCGGDGGGAGGSAACDSITGGTSSVTSTGPASNPAAAADGDLYSYGTLLLTATSQSGTIRATAQDGVVFPAGSRAGAFVTYLNQGSSNATLFRTYLDGVLVETESPGSGIFDPTDSGTGATFYSGFVTSAPFDAVEFSEIDNGANGTAEYRVYEICSDGRA
jgi:hypothetical protein